MENWTETYRGAVPPWECDVTEHFTIAYYFDRLGEAERNFSESLGLREFLRGGLRRRFDVRFARELRAGSSFHIISAPLGVSTQTLRLGHRFVDSANGETVTWFIETWDLSDTPLSLERVDAITASLVLWEGPETEPRPEPAEFTGFLPSARGRAKPDEFNTDGLFGLGSFVHRFTSANNQTGAAIGMDSAYMEKSRRGFSTFELVLQLSGALEIDDPFLIETGVAHLGNSSLRLIHRMTNPRRGIEIARLGQYGVNLDLDARRPAKWPDDIRSRAQSRVIALEYPL